MTGMRIEAALVGDCADCSSYSCALSFSLPLVSKMPAVAAEIARDFHTAILDVATPTVALIEGLQTLRPY